jgi:tetratricopeptide (TPR) repeat protein
VKVFLLFVAISWSFFSCVSDDDEKQSEQTGVAVFSKENDLLKEHKSQILAFADAYETDSAQALLSKIDKSKLDNPLYEGLYYYLDAYILDYQEKYGESITQYQKAIEIFEQNGLDKTLELGLAYNDLAYVYSEVSLEAEALKNYKKAFDIVWNNHQNDPSQVSSVSNNYLGALVGYGDKLNAKEIFEKVEKYFITFLENESTFLAKTEDEKVNLLSFHYLSAIKYFKLNFEETKLKQFIEKMESLFAQTNDELKAKYVSRLIYAYDYAGYAYLSVKSFEKAESQFRIMSEIAVSERDRMKSKSNFAALFLQSGQYAKAEKSYNESLKFIKPDKNNISYLMLETAMAWMVSKQGRHPEALSLIGELWEILGHNKTQLSAIKLEDVGEVNSTRWMFILNATSEICRKYYEQNPEEKKVLADAKNMAILAAKMFQLYYEKEAFNAELSIQNNANREAMLSTLLLYETVNFELEISILENNTSQHLWKTFLNKNEEQIKIPKELIQTRNRLAVNKSSESEDTFEKLESIQKKIEKEAFGFEKNKYRPISMG